MTVIICGAHMAKSVPNLRRTIERLIRRWVPLVGMEHWKIDVRFDEREAAATCVADVRYEEATLYFNLRHMREEYHVLEAVEDVVVHELVHCLCTRSSEMAVTRIARALIRVRDLERAKRG